MLILGTGIDIVEIERFKNIVGRYGERFLSRIYSEREKDYCHARRNLYEHLAARFCAKEAVRKALGNYSPKLRWLDVEVENDSAGKPVIRLSGKAKLAARSIGIRDVLVTLSHSRHYAVAQAVLIK